VVRGRAPPAHVGGSSQRSPDPYGWIKGVGKSEWRGLGKRKGEGVKGGREGGKKQRGDPHPMSEVCSRQWPSCILVDTRPAAL